MLQRQDVETRFLMTAQDRASAVISSVRSEITKVSSASDAVQKAFVAMAAAAPVAALVAKVKSSAELADSLGKLSQRTGIAVESLSAMRYQAELSNVSFEELQTGLTKFNVRVAQAAAGNKEFLTVFERLGFSQADLQANLGDTEGLLRRVADRFASYSDGANKSAIAVKLFEEGGTRLIPLLNEGAGGFENARRELERFGGVVGADFAKQAQIFNDSLTRLKFLSEASSVSIGSSLLPSINRLIEELLKGREIAGSFGKALITFGTINPFRTVAGNIRELNEELERMLANQARALTQGRTGAAAAFNPAIAETRQRLEFLKFQQRQDALSRFRPEDIADARDLRRLQTETQRTQAPSLPAAGAGGQDPGQAFLEQLQKRLVSLEQNEYAVLRLEAAQKKVSSTAEPLIQQLERETEFRKQLAEAQQRDAQAAEAELARRQSLVNGVGDYVKELEQEASLMKLSNDQRLVAVQLLRLEEAGLQRNTEEYQAAKRAIEDAVDSSSAAKIFEETRTPLERYQAQLKRLNDLADKGAIDWDTYERAVRRAEEQLDEFGKTVDETKSLSEELGPILSSGFEEAAFSGGKLRDVIKGLGLDIAKLLFRRNVTKPLVDAIGDFDWGSLFSSIFASANGNIMTPRGPLALQTFAGGGIASGPTLALYGEGSMNEAIIPLPDGRNVPVVLRGGGRGGPVVNVNIENRVGDVTATAGRARTDANGAITIDVIIDRLEPILGRRIQQGGGLAPVLERQYGLSRAAGAYR